MSGRDFRVEGNDTSGYIGVDPEYQTYANSTEAPLLTDAERYDFTDQFVGSDVEAAAIADDEDGNEEPGGDSDEDDDNKGDEGAEAGSENAPTVVEEKPAPVKATSTKAAKGAPALGSLNLGGK